MLGNTYKFNRVNTFQSIDNIDVTIVVRSWISQWQGSQRLGLKPDPALPSERLDNHPSSRGCLAQISRDGGGQVTLPVLISWYLPTKLVRINQTRTDPEKHITLVSDEEKLVLVCLRKVLLYFAWFTPLVLATMGYRTERNMQASVTAVTKWWPWQRCSVTLWWGTVPYGLWLPYHTGT